MLDWDRGIEVIAPTEGAGEAAAPFVRFLDAHGEGVYSVVVPMHGMCLTFLATDRPG